MKKLLLILALWLMSFTVMAQITLQGGDSITTTVYCEPSTGDCPVPVEDIAYAHGGDHKRMAESGDQDCRTCHGADLRGTHLSVAQFARTCIAPDDFQMPDNAMTNERWITTWPDGELLNVVGTETARIEVGDVVGCQMCHEKGEFELGREEFEIKMRDD